MSAVKVMIVDDHPLVRQGLKQILSFQEELEIVGEAQHGDEVVERALALQPDVILLDINLPGKNGIELTGELKAKMPEVNVLVLTVDTEQVHVHKIIKAGALGYLLKDVDPDTLTEAIKAVARGDAYIQPCLLSRLLCEFRQMDDREPQSLPPGQFGLTQRELEIINYIACGQTNKEIAEKLFISEKTVKNHVSSILRKMALDDRTQVAIYAYKKGLIAK
ncbi:MAG TPA: response regulator transcription factor [Bacillota bacterium]|nr:response regulator transcription factor [Bacillota bacterium]